MPRGEHQSETLASDQYDQWDDFVMRARNGSIFHQSWWYQAWDMKPEIRVFRDSRHRLRGGFCYAVRRRYGIKTHARPPLTPRNGPVFLRSRRPTNYARNTDEKRMLLSAIHALPKLGMYDWVLSPFEKDVQPFLWNGFDVAVAYTYVIRKSEANTWQQQTSSMYRRNLRKGQTQADADNCSIELDPPFQEIHPLLAETPRIKKYAASAYMDRLPKWWAEVRARGAGRSYVVRGGDGRPASATLMVWDRRRAYYVAGGLRRDLRKQSGLNLLLIERMIDDAHSRGLHFDFEGSNLPGVERFFRMHGPLLRPIYRVTRFPSLTLFTAWQLQRFVTGHRRGWVWHD